MRHANNCPAILAVILSVVDLLNSERIFERDSRRLKRDPMFGVVRGGLLVVPLDKTLDRRGPELSGSCQFHRGLSACTRSGFPRRLDQRLRFHAIVARDSGQSPTTNASRASRRRAQSSRGPGLAMRPARQAEFERNRLGDVGEARPCADQASG